MSQILDSTKHGLIFEIISARISEEPDNKKYVIYTLQVRYVSENDDLTPSVIERRYTQFQTLYNTLRKEYPSLMQELGFPKKVLTGNFDNELISARSTAFETVLKHISQESNLRTSKAMQVFLQEPELTKAKKLFEDGSHLAACETLESICRLSNKVFSDRSNSVLLILSRLIAYYAELELVPPKSLNWVNLALYRFDGVSDSDLLELYLPLLDASIKIHQAVGKNSTDLDEKLKDFEKKGMRYKKQNLLTALEALESKL